MRFKSFDTKAALVVLHYQNDILHPEGKIKLGFGDGAADRDKVLDAAGRLIRGARDASVPVIHVRTARPAASGTFMENAPIFRNVVAAGAVIEGDWGAEFFEGLGPVAGEIVVVHNRVNGFYDSTLEMRLRGLGATHLVLAGVATNSCVEHTARHAADMGYAVTVAQDACSASRPDVHQAALFNIGLIGSVASVDAIVEVKFQ
ncbi:MULTISPECIES: isochorismatase family cysteine hydrolase [unclassified Rhizobium]|uniref:cysteine hydrolase family protein n=1 Tax=unclassified Rhizobium TaxID=2613769 RepID=UPI00288C2415|nr:MULTISPECIES: isochorismatase family cysteine hydrolase [unclassified Rhizobium]